MRAVYASLGKQEKMECPAQVVEVGLKRQNRQYALEYSLLFSGAVKVSPTGVIFPQKNLLAHARGFHGMFNRMFRSLFLFPSLPVSSD